MASRKWGCVLPDYQRHYCEKIVAKLMKMPISYPFRTRIITENFSNSGLYETAKKPMDLQTIQKKLADNMYANMIEWCQDIRLVWFNARSFYPKSDPIHEMATDLSIYMEPKLKTYPRSPDEEWAQRLQKLSKLIDVIISDSPIRSDLLPLPPPAPKA